MSLRTIDDQSHLELGIGQAEPAAAVAHTPGPWGPNTRVPVRGNAVQIEWLCAVEPDSPRDLEARANARLIAAAPDYHAACGGNLHPGEASMCGPLAWLKEAIDTLHQAEVRKVAVGSDGDPDAYLEMVTEIEDLHRKLSAALAQASGK